jgi:neopullulanase
MSVDSPAWVRDAVFYQVFPDRFASSLRVPKPGPLEPWSAPPTSSGFKGGDLLGIVDRLGYLGDLGVTALYLTPIFTSASNHRYHTDDYFSVDPLLGGDAALRELIDAVHARGMQIVLDGVFNHTGRGFWPFHHVVETGAASPYRGWFHLDEAVLSGERHLRADPTPDEMAEIDRLRGEGTPSGLASQQVLGYRAWWDLPALPKLNIDEPRVREMLFSVAEHWLRYGIDGWRLDVPEEIDDPDFWREFRHRVRTVNPDAYIVGEIWRVAPEWVSGDRFDALMNYPLTEAILGFVTGRHLDRRILGFHHEYSEHVRPMDAAAFASRLDELHRAYDPDVVAVQFDLLSSHDTPRFVTLAGGDRASLRLATLLQMTLTGVPCIYYGDEVGMEGGPDPDCRRAFPLDPATWDADLLGFFRGAVALRTARPALRRGAQRPVVAAGACHVHVRTLDREAVVVAVNASEDEARVAVDVPELAGRALAEERWNGLGGTPAGGEAALDGARLTFAVRPRDGVVLATA